MTSKIKQLMIKWFRMIDKLDTNKHWQLYGKLSIFFSAQVSFIALTIFLEEHQVFQNIINQIFWAVVMTMTLLYITVRLFKGIGSKNE